MKSIFLCHSSKDKPFVRRLAKELKSCGLKVWLDEAEIKVGESLTNKIGAAIHQTDFVAAVLSPNSIKSTWVRIELQMAIQKEIKKRQVVVLPLLRGGLNTKDIPPFLRDKFYADFRRQNKFAESFGLLLDSIGISQGEAEKIRRRFRKKRGKSCYSFPAGKIYLIPSCSSDEKSRYLSEHDIVCADTIMEMFKEAGFKANEDYQLFFQHPSYDDVPDEVRTENLILICGPLRNKLTEKILKIQPPILSSVALTLEGKRPAFIWRGDRYEFEDCRDYALMAIKHNPFNHKRKVVLLFGLTSIGTKGAGSFYAGDHWKQARENVVKHMGTKRSDEIETLLAVDFTPDFQDIMEVTPVISRAEAESVI